MSKVFGIVGNILYIEPFYAGDNIHTASISNSEKSDFSFIGVKEYKSQEELEKDYWSYLDEIFKID